MWAPCALLLLPALAVCFSHQDIELFKLRSAIEKDIGEGTTFYSWLGVKAGASSREIKSAYRKLSRKLHPDRNPGVAANERFARLNQVYKTLRSSAREQYDLYLSQGFPKYSEESDEWTYKRFRPGLMLAFLLVVALGSGIEFVMRKVTAQRRRQHIVDLVDEARSAAASESKTGVVTAATRVRLANSHTFTVHPTGEVFFDNALLTPEAFPEPTWRDTFVGSLISRFRSGAGETEQVEDKAVPVPAPVEEVSETTEKVGKETLKKGSSRRRPAAARGKAKFF